jgi:hypothetical protein
MVTEPTIDAFVYEERQLLAIAQKMPIGYLEDRKSRASDIQIYAEEKMTMYVYTPEAEEYFRKTYDKYAPSTLWEEQLESETTYDPTTHQSSVPRKPKRASGCCDRADQY